MAEAINLFVALQTRDALTSFSSMVSTMKGAGSGLTQIGAAMTAGVTVPILAGLGAATAKAIEFNSAINNSARSLDLTKAETASFSAEVLKLAPTLGLLPAEFADVAGAAGKLGVAKNEVAEFGRILGTLSAISDTPIQQFTEGVGNIKTVFNYSAKEVEKLGAAINTLDDKVGGSTPNILEFTSKTSALGKNMNLGAADLAAFGAVFETVGVKADVGATAFKNFAGKLFTIDAATKDTKEAFESMGYSASEFGAIMSRDPKAALIDFLDRLNSISDPVRKQTLLLKIFGDSSGSEIASLASQAGKLSEAFKLVGNDTANLAKMNSEFSAKMADPAMQMKVIQAQLVSMGTQIGLVLLPAITDILNYLSPLVTKLTEVAAQDTGLLKVGIAILGIAALAPPITAFVGTLVSFIGIVGTIIKVVVSLGGIVSTAGLIFTTVSGTIGTFIAAIFTVPVAIAVAVAGIIALVFNVGGCRDKLVQLAGFILGGLHQAFLTLGNFIIDTVGKLLNLSSAITIGLYKAFVSLVGFVMGSVHGAFLALGNLLINTGVKAFQLAGNLTNAIGNALRSVVSSAQSMGYQLYNAIISALNNGLAAIRNVSASFYNAGIGLMSSFADGVRASAASAYNSVASVTSQIRNLLPFSPAKEGALKDLDKSGASFFKTFASGMLGDDLYNKVNSVLDNVTLTGSAGSTNNGLTATVAAGTKSVSGGTAPIINYTQNNTITASVNSAEIITALRSREREFLEFIKSAEFFKNRRQV